MILKKSTQTIIALSLVILAIIVVKVKTCNDNKHMFDNVSNSTNKIDSIQILIDSYDFQIAQLKEEQKLTNTTAEKEKLNQLITKYNNLIQKNKNEHTKINTVSYSSNIIDSLRTKYESSR